MVQPKLNKELTTAKLVTQNYKVVALDELKEHPKNPRRGDVQLIQKSIEANDFYGAVYAQKSTGMILAGNHRWKAAKLTGLKTIPTIFLDVDDATAMKILLADNKTSDSAVYDNAVLLDVLQTANMDVGGLAGTGYDVSDLARLLAASVPAPIPVPVTPSIPPPPKVPAHEEKTKMVHTCPQCSYEWSSAK